MTFRVWKVTGTFEETSLWIQPVSLLLTGKDVKRAPLFLQGGAQAHFPYSGWWAYSSARWYPRASHFFIHIFGAHCTTMTLKLPSATYEFLCLNLNTVFNSTSGSLTFDKLSGSSYTLETTNIHFLATFSLKSSWRLLKLSLGWELVSLGGFFFVVVCFLFHLAFFRRTIACSGLSDCEEGAKKSEHEKTEGGGWGLGENKPFPPLFHFLSSSFLSPLSISSVHSPLSEDSLNAWRTPEAPGTG